MKTIQDFLNILDKDKEIQELIFRNEWINKKYKETKRRLCYRHIKTNTGKARDYFWKSVDGVKLRLIMETRYKMNTQSTQQIGKLKDALTIYLNKKEPGL